jgi:hypothetical protein
MFNDRLKIIILILIAAGLASFYDFLLFLDRHRSWLISNPYPDAPLVFYSIPFVVVSRHLLSLLTSVYALLGAAAIFIRTRAVYFMITALTNAILLIAAVLFIMFGGLARIEDAAIYIIFAAVIFLYFNLAEVKNRFDNKAAPQSGASGSNSPLRVFSYIFSINFLLILLYVSYIAAAYNLVRPAPAVNYEKPRSMQLDGDYRTIYKYSVFIPAGYKMQTAVIETAGGKNASGRSSGRPAGGIMTPAMAAASREFICTLTKGDDRLMISDNRGRVISELRKTAAFFYLESEREFIKLLVNERFGIVTMTVKKLMRDNFYGEASSPDFSGFYSDISRPPAGREHYYELNLWDASAQNSVRAAFSPSSTAAGAAVADTVISTLALENKVKSASDYHEDGVALYGAGALEEAKFCFMNAIYYNYSDYTAHYYLARCFYETGSSDSSAILHLNYALACVSANRLLPESHNLKPVLDASGIAPALAGLASFFGPASVRPGFFY